MRYRKISSLIKKRKELLIYNICDGSQWISDGIGAYPVIGMPTLSETEMLRFLDLDLKDNINVTERPVIGDMFSDTDPKEILIKKLGPSLLISGNEYYSFYTDVGAIIAEEKYFAPAFTRGGEGEFTYWLRFNGGLPLITVKKGLYLTAAINPIMSWKEDNKIRDDYEKLCEMLRISESNFGKREETVK